MPPLTVVPPDRCCFPLSNKIPLPIFRECRSSRGFRNSTGDGKLGVKGRIDACIVGERDRGTDRVRAGQHGDQSHFGAAKINVPPVPGAIV